MSDGEEEVSDQINHSTKRREDGLVACFEMTSGDKGESLVGSTSEVDASWSVTESAMVFLRRGRVKGSWLLSEGVCWSWLPDGGGETRVSGWRSRARSRKEGAQGKPAHRRIHLNLLSFN